MSDVDIPLSQIRLHNCLHLLGLTILFYDHAITFDDEYWRIWKHPRSGASWLFFVNRYFAFFANIAVGAGNFSSFRTDESCVKYAFYRQMILIISQIIVGINQFLRTYALYGRDRRVAVFIVSVMLFLISISIWAVIGQKSAVSLVDGCHLAASRPTAIRIAVAWEALFTFDVLIFAMTLLKTWRQRFRYAPGVRNGLVTLMLRDGAIYFGVMAIAQCTNTLTFYLLQPALRGVLSTFAGSISVSMMSRLMLNLHRSASDNKRNYSATTQPTSVNSTTMLFTSRYGLPSPQALDTTIAGTATVATSAVADCEKCMDSVPEPPMEEEFELVEIRRTD